MMDQMCGMLTSSNGSRMVKRKTGHTMKSRKSKWETATNKFYRSRYFFAIPSATEKQVGSSFYSIGGLGCLKRENVHHYQSPIEIEIGAKPGGWLSLGSC